MHLNVLTENFKQFAQMRQLRAPPPSSSPNRPNSAPRPNIPLRYPAGPTPISVNPPPAGAPKAAPPIPPKLRRGRPPPFLQLSPVRPLSALPPNPGRHRSATPARPAPRPGPGQLSPPPRRSSAPPRPSFGPPKTAGSASPERPGSAADDERLRATFAPQTPENIGPPKLSPPKSPRPSQSAASFGDGRDPAVNGARSRNGTGGSKNPATAAALSGFVQPVAELVQACLVVAHSVGRPA
jgi:hypothetical protein